jgi:glutathione S-transferase
MRLIGMLDSPYVRRVAISLRLMELPFSHEALSVFRNFDAFAAINPVVKAPTFVADDGTVLMDSALILEYLERLVPPGRSLTPVETASHARAQRIVGLALAASDKSVQIVYERSLRPPEKQHQPWIDRVQGQLEAAYRELEREIAAAKPWLFGNRPLQADITSAVSWRFTQMELPGLIRPELHPALAALSLHAENTPAFQAFPPN